MKADRLNGSAAPVSLTATSSMPSQPRRLRPMTFLLAALLIITAMCAPAMAADYHVSPQGDDSNSGTNAQKALRTIAAAVAKARAGDNVLIAPGRYAERVTVKHSGTAEAPITLRHNGESGEVVWTTPDDDPRRFQDKYALNIEGQRYIVVRGLTFRDCQAWIMLWESDHCTIVDCTFDGVQMYNALRINNGSFNRILDSRFVRGTEMTGFRKEADWIPVPGCDYIEIFRNSHNNLVQGCTFGPITHMAVSISAVDPKAFSPTRNVVRNNTFSDPFWKCIWLHAGKHNLVEDNLFSGKAANFIQLESGTSIIRRNRFVHYRDTTDGQPDALLRGAIRIQFDFAQGNRLYNNLFHDNDRTLTNNSFRWHVTDNIFLNNIFADNRQTVFLGFPDFTTRNLNYFINNVILQQKPGEKLIRLTRSQDFTLAEAQAAMPQLYSGNIESDPRLALTEGRAVGLQKDSPCIDAGRYLTRTSAAGQGTEVTVQDALWFSDGNGLIDGDEVVIGGKAAVRITKVDYDTHTLTLQRPLQWQAGDSVNLTYKGRGPDIGPFEFEGDESTSSGPQTR